MTNIKTTSARAKPVLMPTELILVHYSWTGPIGRRMSGFHEIDDDNNGRNLIMRAMASGEYDGADRVIELTTDGRWNDISEDMAREIIDYAIPHFGFTADGLVAVGNSVRAFIEEHIGFSAIAEIERSNREVEHETAR